MSAFGGKPDVVASQRPVRYDCVPGTQFESSGDHHAVRLVPKVSDAVTKASNLRAFAG